MRQCQQSFGRLFDRQHGTAVKAAVDRFAVPEGCIHRTKGEGADADAVLPFFDRQATAEGLQGSFASAVGPPVGEGIAGGMAADINDQTATAALAIVLLGTHQRQNQLTDLKDAGDIQLE